MTRGTLSFHPQIRTWSFSSSRTASAIGCGYGTAPLLHSPDLYRNVLLDGPFDETNLATQGPAAQARARLLLSNEHQERPPRAQGAPPPGPQTPDGLAFQSAGRHARRSSATLPAH